MAKRDFYEVLGVSKSCDERELKTSYRKLAMQFHPDRNGGDRRHEAQLTAVVDAYQLLKKSAALA